jgi:putative acetyltransferase
MTKLELRTLALKTDVPAAREILREYASSLSFDLCFQDFDAELAALPGQYAEPRGAFLMALEGGLLIGCCALRPLDNVDTPNACEMKRLYVRPAHRRSGAGRLLAEAVMVRAQLAGYSYLLLDTLSDMEAARALYTDLGFEEIAPYYHNPIKGSHYLRVKL